MPTVVIGNNTGDDYSGTEDAAIYGTTLNYGAQTESGCFSNRNLLIKFSGLSSISGPVTVSSAVLSLYKISGSANGDISIRRLLRDWVEGTQNGGDRANDTPDSCCWNEYGSGNSWTTAGGLGDGTDRVTSTSATLTVGATTGAYYNSGELSMDVAGFINGTSNYGWHLSSSLTAYQAYFRMKNYGTSGTLPYLTVTYTESGGASAVPAIMMSMNQFNGGMQ